MANHPVWHHAVRVARLGGYGASKAYRKAATSCQQKFPVPLTVPLKLRLTRISTCLGSSPSPPASCSKYWLKLAFDTVEVWRIYPAMEFRKKRGQMFGEATCGDLNFGTFQ